MADSRDKHILRKPKTEINHKNNDPTDNTIDNVELTEAPADPESLQRAADILAGRSPPSDTTLEMSPEEIGLYNRVIGVSDPAKPKDGVATTIRHGNEMLGVWDRITPYRFRSDPDHAMAPVTPAPNSVGQRPYLLESALVEQTLRRQRDAALAEIDAVDADMLAIETQANNEIADIRSRTDTEIAARKARKDDLQAIVAMASRALPEDVAQAKAALDAEQARIEADLERRAEIGDEYREAIDKTWRGPE